MINDDEELRGAFELDAAILKGEWPHTLDARVWAAKWLETLAMHPRIATDEGTMIGWFANAIMAGYDAAHVKDKTMSKLTLGTNVVRDGSSFAMLEMPDGRIFRFQQLGVGQFTWGNCEDNDELCGAIDAVIKAQGEPVAWRPVVGFEESYEVSNAGQVRSARTGRLSPDVREALSEMDDYMDSVLGEYPEGSAAWTALRAELLRLASAEAELAKLRARIEDAPRVLGEGPCIEGHWRFVSEPMSPNDLDDLLTGQRVALVKLPDGDDA